MKTTTIALGIPHTPWRPERVEALKRLKYDLGLERGPGGGIDLRVFGDREPNHVWSERMWGWGLETGADFFLTLQDDSIVAPFFWQALLAMLEQLPRRAILGLAAVHPAGPELAAAGERWYRTKSWAIGWGYGLWRGDLEAFLAWRAREPLERLQRTNEDSLLNDWVGSVPDLATWHPLPTIVQHDLSLETNYPGNDRDDDWRESSLTWQHVDHPDGVDLGEELGDPDFWRRSATRRKAAAMPPMPPWPAPKVVARPELPPLREAEAQPGTISLAISHTPWVPARVESVKRLADQLELDLERDACPHAYDFQLITDRAPNDVWSERMWRWAAESPVEHCLFLQDDVEVCPRFWTALRALLEAVPDQVIGLEVAHPIARALASAEPPSRLFTTSDMLIGPGYVLPRALLREFLEWRRTKLRAGWIGTLHEDTMIGLWCATTGRRIYHPVPTLIDHDTSIASTYGNDDHTNRRPHVTWKDGPKHGHAWDPDCTDLEGPGFWKGMFQRIPYMTADGTPAGYRRARSMDPAVMAAGARVPHLGLFYDTTPARARRWVEGVGDREVLRLRQDTGDREKRRLAYGIRARGDWTGKARIIVCTPTRGGTHPIYTASMTSLVSLFEADVEHGLELLETWRWSEDVVRVRSRFLAAARETDATHVHFRDADVAAPVECLLGMLHADRDFVAAPYPRRDHVDWTRIATAVAGGDPRHPEAMAYSYPVARLPGSSFPPDVDQAECTEVAAMPLGCALIRRSCFEAMIDRYDALDRRRVDLDEVRRVYVDSAAPSSRMLELAHAMADELERWRAGHMGLRFTDLDRGMPRETVALFQLLSGRGPEGASPLASEDASFCTRWRDMGGKVWMYLGRGSPVDHAGDHVYRGHVEAFGLQRLTAAQIDALARHQAAAAPAPDGEASDTDRPPATEHWTMKRGYGTTGAHLTPKGDELERAFALDTPEDPRCEPEEPAVP